MKKFTLLLTVALMAVLSYAQTPMLKPSRVLQPQTPKSMDSKMLKRHGQNSSQALRFNPNRAASDYTIITDTPEGEMKTYKRSGSCYVSAGSGYVDVGTQSGKVNIVFNGSDVYIQGVIAENTYGSDAWVKGTLSEDGKTITLPLFQNLYYVSSYDACLMIAVGSATSTSYKVDESIKQVTYTIDGETITLNGSSEDSLFGIYWTDDHAWQGFGEWDTVLTEYVPDYSLVTPPEGLVTTDMPLSAFDWDEKEVTGTAKVGIDGSDIYFQGVVAALPEVWLKGTLNDGVVTIPITYIGQLEGNDLWAAGYGGGALAPIEFIYDSEANTYELDGYLLLNTNDDTFEYSYSGQSFIEAYTGTFIGNLPATVEVPEDLTTKEMPFAGVNDEEKKEERTVIVGIDGNDVYIQGLLNEVAEGWVKGSFNDDKTQVTFPIQYVGRAEEMGYTVYLLGSGIDEESSTDPIPVVFSYDADSDVFTSETAIFANASRKDKIYYSSYYEPGVVIGTNIDATWIAANQGYENAEEIAEIDIDPGVTVGVLNQDEGNNPPKYYNSGTSLRMYAGNTLVINSTKTLSKIVFTMTGSTQQKELEASIGDYSFEEDNNQGTWTGEASEITFSVPNESGFQARIQRIDVYYLDYAKTLVEAPEDLVTESYYFKGTDTYYNEEVTRTVKVGFYGDEVYMQGLSDYIEDAWVKGTLKDGKLTIPGWYLGLFQSLFGPLELVFSGAEMTYDADANQFTCPEFQSIVVGDDFFMDEYADVTITKIIEKAATPAQPEITAVNFNTTYPNIYLNVPMLDENGDPLMPEKLSYQLFTDINGTVAELVFDPAEYKYLTEEMTVIPYLFTDDYDIYEGGSMVYINQANYADWNKIGVKSIYTGGGETNESEIFWYVIKEPSGISTVANDVTNDAVWHNLQGMRVKAPTQKGVFIRNGRKVVVK